MDIESYNKIEAYEIRNLSLVDYVSNGDVLQITDLM